MCKTSSKVGSDSVIVEDFVTPKTFAVARDCDNGKFCGTRRLRDNGKFYDGGRLCEREVLK